MLFVATLINAHLLLQLKPTCGTLGGRHGAVQALHGATLINAHLLLQLKPTCGTLGGRHGAVQALHGATLSALQTGHLASSATGGKDEASQENGWVDFKPGTSYGTGCSETREKNSQNHGSSVCSFRYAAQHD